MGKSNLFSIEDQFAFYGAYHTHPVNITIHMICIPIIFFTSLTLAHYFSSTAYATFDVPLPAALGLSSLLPLDVTVSFLVAAGYATYFVLLEPVAGLLYAPFLLAMGHYSNVIYDTVPDGMRIAGYFWVSAWIAQFIGHGKFEGRAPALFTSLFQSLVLAVFFVFLEGAFLLGYRPELNKRLQNRIGVAVTEYRRGKAEAARAKKTS